MKSKQVNKGFVGVAVCTRLMAGYSCKDKKNIFAIHECWEDQVIRSASNWDVEDNMALYESCLNSC